jgi:S1-C subfamily serine protease
VTAADVLLVGVLVLAASAGWRLGLVARVLSWLGLVAGLAIAVQVLPGLSGRLSGAEQGVVLMVIFGVVAVFMLGGQAIGLVLGARLRGGTPSGVLGAIDRSLGALVGAAGVLAVVWLLLPVFASSGGPLAREVRASQVAALIDRHLPEPPDTVQALRSFVGGAPFPDVFAGLRPTPDLGPPPASTGLDAAQGQRAASAVVQVEAQGCGRLQNGTGFVVVDARPGTVVTNAHVVAGAERIVLRQAGGQRWDAVVLAFDPVRDVAVLAGSGLDLPALALGRASVGDVGGVFGHPGGEALRVAPASVEGSLTAAGRTIYGSSGAARRVLELAADLRPGDSGAPLVNDRLEVSGVVFAIATDRGGVAYALDTREINDVLAGNLEAGTATGPCIN